MSNHQINTLNIFREDDCYFVDKTVFIQTIVQQGFITGELKAGFPAEQYSVAWIWLCAKK